ncbi:FeS assembly SUF system protein [Nibricoccus aquaticus]|uniref:FeS assembly SUF system protein n=1 Tax=Nibricoccus aquaticus TaxID=2576891 RepID=A0A290Q4D5_9BACT|nr:metal-sulfur cluster assembly factor [Nibricoccus aquaticus]ATC63535.1 FeS assembly SUF system protein [Nibricoccus aquaticus]
MKKPTEILTHESAMAELGTILDPEFGLSIVALGLIYDVQISDAQVTAVMTLTSPYCPAGDVIMGGVQSVLERIGGGRTVKVQLTWEPQWTPAMMTRAACEELGWKEMDEL